jgi:hypothetical protein
MRHASLGSRAASVRSEILRPFRRSWRYRAEMNAPAIAAESPQQRRPIALRQLVPISTIPTRRTMTSRRQRRHCASKLTGTPGGMAPERSLFGFVGCDVYLVEYGPATSAISKPRNNRQSVCLYTPPEAANRWPISELRRWHIRWQRRSAVQKMTERPGGPDC